MRPDDDETKLPPEQPEAEEEEARGGRKMDEELKALAAILRVLDDLPDPARRRAVAWIHSRYSEKE